MVKNPSAVQETRVRSLGREDPLKKGMATLSRILACEIPWAEEPGGLQCGCRVGYDWTTNTFDSIVPLEPSLWVCDSPQCPQAFLGPCSPLPDAHSTRSSKLICHPPQTVCLRVPLRHTRAVLLHGSKRQTIVFAKDNLQNQSSVLLSCSECTQHVELTLPGKPRFELLYKSTSAPGFSPSAENSAPVSWTRALYDTEMNRAQLLNKQRSLLSHEIDVCACVLSCFSRVWLFVTPWTIAHLAPYSPGKILEWVAMPSSRASSQPRDQTHVSYVSCIGRWVLYHWCHLGSPERCINTDNFHTNRPLSSPWTFPIQTCHFSSSLVW